MKAGAFPGGNKAWWHRGLLGQGGSEREAGRHLEGETSEAEEPLCEEEEVAGEEEPALLPQRRRLGPAFVKESQGAVKGVYLKRLLAQSRLFYREMDCPVRFHREMDCPVQWSLATPSALESQSRAEQGSVVANPICKCRRHKAGHLQV